MTTKPINSILFIFLIGVMFVSLGSGGINATGNYPAVDPNMVLYYHFNNQSAYGENDTFVYDFSGNGNNGTITGGTYNLTGGYLGDGSLNLNGNNQYVTSNKVFNASVFTLSSWVYVFGSPAGGNAEALIWKDNDFGMRLSWTGMKLQCFVYNGTLLNTQSTAVVTLNTWNLLTCSANGTTMTGYINGIPDGTINYTLRTMNGNVIRIGKPASDQTKDLNGSIDETIIYNISLTTKQVQSLYNTYEGCFNISTNNTLVYFDKVACGGVVNINLTTDTQVVRIMNSNLVLDLNGTVFNGNDSTYSRAIYLKGMDNVLIKNFTSNHYFWGVEVDETSGGIRSNITLQNFLVNSYKQTGVYLKNANHVTLQDFIINNSDMGVYMINSSNILIQKGNISSSDGTFDGYSTGINIDSYSKNITIFNNSIWDYGCMGVLIRQNSSFINISNNYFNQRSFANQLLDLSKRYYCGELDPSSAIASLELYGGWTGHPNEEPPINNVSDINHIGTYASNNLFISGNTFGSNVQSYLTLQGTTNVTHDLTNYWYRSFQFPTYLVDKTEVYASNNYDNLSIVGNWTNTYNYGGKFAGLTDLFYQKYARQGNSVTYKIHNDYMYFNNLNGTQYDSNGNIVTNIMDLNLYNLSNSLLVYDNGTTIPIYGTNQEYNLTLQPNQYVYVYTYDSYDALYLAVNGQAQLSKNNFCNNVTSGFDNFFTGIIVIFGLLAVGIIILILFILIQATENRSISIDINDIFEKFPVKEVFIALSGITILVFVILQIFGVLCG